MATKSGRGIGNMGDIRRPPPLRYFLQLYQRQPAFQAAVDFAVLGGLTVAFLHPQFGLNPFAGKNNTTPSQQIVAPSPPPSPRPVSTPSQTQAGPTNNTAAPPAKPAPVASNAAPPSTADSPAVVNLKKLPPYPVIPVTPVNTPGLQSVPIPFTNFVIGAVHPASRYVTVDDRAFVNLPYALRETVKTALAARDDQDAERMRDVLKDADSPEGTPELLVGLSYLINATPESVALAEKSYRVALQKGQPQAPVLLGLLLTSKSKGVIGTFEEGKELVKSVVLTNDRVAWLAAGNSYLSGENGTLDPVKAASWITKSAEAGEPLALLQYARLAEGGIGMEKNMALAEGALRRAADLGLTEAQDTLARWIMIAYEKKFIDDPTEAVKLDEKLASRHLIFAISNLARLYLSTGRSPAWKDDARAVKLLQECTPYKVAPCHNNFGMALQFGRGIDRDIVAAWAHYDVGRQLNPNFVMLELDRLDKTMTSAEKDEAHKQSRDIMAGLKNLPMPITLRRDE